MKKKYFITSDVHSFYKEWKKALKKAGFDIDNKDHIIIHCGDLLDRGPDAIKCLKFVNKLPKDRKILIRGNHEDLLEDAIYRGYFQLNDYYNGTVDTVAQLTKRKLEDTNTEVRHAALIDVKENKDLKKYLKSTIDYYEIGNSIFCHGWLPVSAWTNKDSPDDVVHFGVNENFRNASTHAWRDARWENGIQAWDLGSRLEGKTIYCGHYHTSWGHHYLHKNGSEFGDDAIFDPFIDDGIVALDACTAYSHKVNIVTIEEDID